ncbi:MAG: DNA internalization-related competence protein ComEC/Rec2 [Acidobacteriota bacterium]
MHRPLFWCAAAFSGGLLLSFPALTAMTWAAVGTTSLLGSIVLGTVASGRITLRLAASFVLLGFFCAGRVAGIGYTREDPSRFSLLVARHPKAFSRGADLEGRLVRLRWIRKPWPRLLMTVAVDSAKLGRSRIPSHGRVVLYAPSHGSHRDHAILGARRGDRLTLFARVRLPRRFLNGGWRTRQSAPGVANRILVGSVKSWRLIGVEADDRPGLSVRALRSIDRLRSAMLDRLQASFPASASGLRAAAVCTALLVGDRTRLSSHDADVLRDAGLTHLLAVSGFNVAILAWVALWLFRLVGLRRQASLVGIIPVLFIYLLLNSGQSSVKRAVLMAVLYFLGRVVWRRVDVLNTLGLAAVVILIGNPAEIATAGFQLSFVATLSLLGVAKLSSRLSPKRSGLRRAASRWVTGMVAATLAAVLATMPLTALHFNRMTPAAIPANLIGAPIVAASFIATLAIAAIAPFSRMASAAIGGLVTHGFDILFPVVGWLGALPGLSYRRPTPGSLLILTFYAGLIATWLVLLSRRPPHRLLRWGAFGLLAVGTISLALPLDTRRAPTGLRTTMLDVGQGDAILIETPTGGRLLVDAGGSPAGRFDIGEHVVSRALWRMGIARLDAVAVSHMDEDHAGGAPAVLKNFGPGQFWIRADGPTRHERARIDALIQSALQVGSRVHIVSGPEKFAFHQAVIEILDTRRRGPAFEPGRSRNDQSLVMRISWQGRHVLLVGDAGEPTERILATEPVEAELLKVGHHGSRSGTTERFLRMVHPRVALISCGRHNRFGHPHPEVLARLEGNGVRICRSDLHGSVSIELLAGGTRIDRNCAIATGARSSWLFTPETGGE